MKIKYLSIIALLILMVASRLILKFEFHRYEFGILIFVIILLFKDDLGSLFEEITIPGFKLKTRLSKIEKDQRQYAIIGPGNNIIHSTFREEDFSLISFDPKNLKLKFRLSPKPDYIEVRSNLGAVFYIEFKNGVYECRADGLEESPLNKAIVEAYYK